MRSRATKHGICVMLAGGGSGGHISPGLAISERIAELDPRAASIFVCSQREIDRSMLTDAGAEFIPVPATPPSKNPIAACRFALSFQASKRIIKRLIRQREVSQVITLGGFVAAPAVIAARDCGVPVMLVNLDSPPGRANLWMAKRSDAVVSAIALPGMPGFASRIVGMPIRRRAIATGSPGKCRARLDLDVDRPTLLVTGASQGATSINEFMIALIQSDPRMLEGWQVYHLSGQGADEGLRAAYKRARVRAVVQPFLNEIGLAWGAADLAISRAGASSVAEVAHNAVPTIFLPYPYHKDMHQKFNAQPLVDLGGAFVATDFIDAARNVAEIGPLVQALLHDDVQRTAMRTTLCEHPFPDAAMTIAKIVIGESQPVSGAQDARLALAARRV